MPGGALSRVGDPVGSAARAICCGCVALWRAPAWPTRAASRPRAACRVPPHPPLGRRFAFSRTNMAKSVRLKANLRLREWGHGLAALTEGATCRRHRTRIGPTVLGHDPGSGPQAGCPDRGGHMPPAPADGSGPPAASPQTQQRPTRQSPKWGAAVVMRCPRSRVPHRRARACTGPTAKPDPRRTQRCR